MRYSDNNTRRGIRRLTKNAMLLGLALLLSYIEAVLPLTAWIPLPGMRLGLCQLAVTAAFFWVGRLDAALISATRVALTGFLFGSATSLWFSACGALLAYMGLWFGEKLGRRMSYAGLGILCAALHNIGQCLAAALLFGSGVLLSYLPVLLLAAVLFGGAGGLLLNELAERLLPIVSHGEKQ